MHSDLPQKLRPYAFHGLRLGKPKNNECHAECPFCGRDKFSVNIHTGQWRCWVCAEGSKKGGGNVYTFLRRLHDVCMDATTVEQYRELVSDRGFLDATVLIEWGIVMSSFTGDWLIPGYNMQRQLTSLYRYAKQRDGGYRLLPTPTLGHHLHGMNLWDDGKAIVYICEGPWDAMALFEVMTQCKNGEGGLVQTSNRDSSLFSQCNIIAVPGCEVFFDVWMPLFERKIVNLMFDSDHPRKHPKTGHVTEGAGLRGMKRIAEMFSVSAHKPQEVNYVHWGDDGYDLRRKSGFDIRDLITKG